MSGVFTGNVLGGEMSISFDAEVEGACFRIYPDVASTCRIRFSLLITSQESETSQTRTPSISTKMCGGSRTGRRFSARQGRNRQAGGNRQEETSNTETVERPSQRSGSGRGSSKGRGGGRTSVGQGQRSSGGSNTGTGNTKRGTGQRGSSRGRQTSSGSTHSGRSGQGGSRRHGKGEAAPSPSHQSRKAGQSGSTRHTKGRY
eukprot:XP_011678376.1 PREDICTED: protein rtoA [Strongylocentrotus purpuratus]